MVKITAIKEALKALFRNVTTKYPHGPPTHLPPGFRGLPQFDDKNCIGCGACAVSCSASAIMLVDAAHSRSIQIPPTRCIFCGRCEDICPEEGISLSDRFELATSEKDLPPISIEFELVSCRECGMPISTSKHLDKIRISIMENIDSRLVKEAESDFMKYMTLCTECRRKLSYKLNTHTQKYYLRSWEE